MKKKNEAYIKAKIIMVIKIILAILIFGPLFIFGTMFLWNWLVPKLFNGPVINFWQTLGLVVLSKIFFSGFGGKKHKKGHCNDDNKWGWKNRMEEKMSNMTPEEKEQFKQRLKDKCGNKFWPSDGIYKDEVQKNDLG